MINEILLSRNIKSMDNLVTYYTAKNTILGITDFQ